MPSCTPSGNNNGCRPNPNYGNNSQYSPSADAQYDGLQVSFVQRPVRWGSYRISYNFSKTLDDVGEFFFSSPINNYNVWQDWALSDDNQPNRLVFAGTAQTPTGPAKGLWEHLSHDFQLSGTLQYYSAFPFNVTTGSTTIQGTTARPTIGGGYIGRNTGTGFDFFTVNARLSRTFTLERWRLEALVEAFNLLNHRNNMIPNTTFGTGAYPENPRPTFGTPTAVGDPRTLQLGLRITF